MMEYVHFALNCVDYNSRQGLNTNESFYQRGLQDGHSAPGDQHLLGVEWERVIFMEKTLSFGHRHALKIFSAVPDGS